MIFSQFCTYSRYRVINSFAISLDICGVYFPSILHFVYVIIMEITKRGKTSSRKAVGPKPKRQRRAKSSAERAAETPVPVNHRDRMITLCCQSKWSLTSGGNRLGFHMIADDRESQIVDRRKFCDRLRSYGNPLLRSFAIVCDPAIVIADDRRR